MQGIWMFLDEMYVYICRDILGYVSNVHLCYPFWFFYCQFRNFLSFFKNVLYNISPFFMHNFFWAVTKSIAIISDILCYFIVLWVRMEHSLCFFCFLLIYNLYFLIERKCTFFLLNLHTKNLCFKLLYKIGFCSLYYLLLIFWSERDFCITLKFVQCYSLPGSILFLVFLVDHIFRH